MMAFLKKNWVTVLIVVATVILAGIAVYTAIRLYQLRQTTVAPNAPSSQPGAFQYGADCASLTTQEQCQASECRWNVSKNKCDKGNACLVSFSLTTLVSSPTPTPTASSSSSPTPTPTAPPSCGDSCSLDTDCPSGMSCDATAGVCRNTSCTTEENCICSSSTPTPTPTPAIPLSCGDSCTSNSDCANNMVCVSGGVCRNPSCLNATDCTCATSTPSGTSTPVAGGTTTPAPSLPESGTSTPAIVGAAAGILLLLGAFILVL